ncbi:MAG: hypothetical protein JEZ00_18075 [Anaerolineaceae bacterium]|nr:hypothetical protein [Anaerolineaceae bacterium]
MTHFHAQVNNYWQHFSRRLPFPKQTAKTVPAAPGFLSSLPVLKQLSQSPALQRALAVSSGVLLALLVFSAVISSNTPTRSSNYYDQLADAFLAGQVHLPEHPPAPLLALDDPYDWTKREGIDYLWDATLYQGEYYLYWGAVPALIAALVKLIHPMILLDQSLVWAFWIGICIIFALLVSLLHKQLFPTQPAWMLFPFASLAGIAMPMLWLTTRPSVYESAIASGQFFLLVGLYAALRALWSESKTGGWLLLAGFAWGAAVNCRLNLAVGVGWFGLCLAYFLFRKNHWTRWLQQMTLLALPLILWMGAMAGYNFLRFGNPLETGHKYQLNGPGMPTEYSQVMSLGYLLPSLYSYLIRPFLIEGHTPYVSVPFISEQMWPFFIRLPKYYYYPEPTAGILLTTPVVWLAFLPLLNGLKKFKDWLLENNPLPEAGASLQLRQFWWIGGGTAGILFFILLIFNAASMRYLADVLPMILLLSTVGFYWARQQIQDNPVWKPLLSLTAGLLFILSAVFSVLANLSNHF